MRWKDAQEQYLGKWQGRRTAYVVDVTLGADLVVIYGRRGPSAICWTESREKFDAWIAKHKAKRIAAA